MPLSFLKLFKRLARERRVANQIQAPIVESTAKEILESQKSGDRFHPVAATHLALTKKAGFGLFNFLSGAGS